MEPRYTNYKEYLKNKKLAAIKCDPNIQKLSNIINYPDYKQLNQFIMCKPSLERLT